MRSATATMVTRAKTNSAREIDKPYPKRLLAMLRRHWGLECHGSGAKRIFGPLEAPVSSWRR